ncbi:hypothetical protein MIND_00987800 [Mycena indigotica]|uniref:Cytochrome P450 n=1 Tax=Mycena indigotica TaxID=2126181 RepID=A0A8H6SF26_9AGAR|nr:uncharacterized protein MIND_00987800 [Mycena indigotica]KAF7297536.1 hypothetical protein MIND_00987800 [Mycena indigotica]
MLFQILVPISITLAVYVVLHAAHLAYRTLSSPLRNLLSGPPMTSVIFGNFMEMADNLSRPSAWRKEYGPTFMYHGLFGVPELHTSDLKALNHMMAHPQIYQRADTERDMSRRLMGEGILYAETDQHRRHRRVLNPAFGVAQIKLMTEIFIEKALHLRDVWAREIERQSSDEGEHGTIEVLSGLRKVTLDIIGRAGFGYEFNALEGKTNELNQALTDLFHSPQANFYGAIRLIQSFIPILKLVPLPGTRVLHIARTRMDDIGSHIVEDSKAALIADKTIPDDKGNMLKGRRDLLSVLLKANMSDGLPESQKLADDEVLSQIPAFFLAGHETTSAATSWALHALSVNKAVQDRLREELLSVGTDNPTLDELNALPLLEKVIRETMRLHAPVTHILRKSMIDDILPLSKPIVDHTGKEHWSLPIAKGQMLHLPLWAVNTSTETWGEDALEFKPDRWDHIPEAASAVPGVWANLFTFFAGPHNCIGFRFSLAELKAILFTLLRAFEFSPAVPEGEIGPLVAGVLQHPGLLTNKEQGSGLPLVLTPVKSAA